MLRLKISTSSADLILVIFSLLPLLLQHSPTYVRRTRQRVYQMFDTWDDMMPQIILIDYSMSRTELSFPLLKYKQLLTLWAVPEAGLTRQIDILERQLQREHEQKPDMSENLSESNIPAASLPIVPLEDSIPGFSIHSLRSSVSLVQSPSPKRKSDREEDPVGRYRKKLLTETSKLSVRRTADERGRRAK